MRTLLAAAALSLAIAVSPAAVRPADAQTLGGIGDACQGLGWGRILGGVAGAVGGGLLGREVLGGTLGTIVGGAAGAFGGQYLGRQLDPADCAAARRGQQQAFDSAPAGQTIAWDNPGTGARGTVTPIRDGTDTSTGQRCREFEQTIVVDGRSERATGVACRQSDGTWRIVQQD
jgi:surface antigen